METTVNFLLDANSITLDANAKTARAKINADTNSDLARRIESVLFRNQHRFLWLQVILAGLFLVLVFIPVCLPTTYLDLTLITALNQASSFIVWGLWFPLVLISVVFTGRSWCGIFCPMGACSEWANKHGLKRSIPGWLKWEGTPIVSFILITILGQTLGVREHPEALAQIFGMTFIGAIVIGFLYGMNKRTWCRHACPIGLLLGVFSRLGAVSFALKKRLQPGARYTEKGVCPTFVDIRHKDESRHCIECCRCINPKASGGLKLRLRRPGGEIETISKHNANSSEVAFLFLATGTALGSFLWLVLPLYQDLRSTVGGWFIDNDWFWIGEAGPAWLMSVHPERFEVFNWLDFIMIVGFILTSMILTTLVLTLSTVVSAWFSKRFGGSATLKERFIELGYLYIPVAMLSLLIGLGGELFNLFAINDFMAAHVQWIKMAVFSLAFLWSIYLGDRILYNQGVTITAQRMLALTPSTIGSTLIGFAWWTAMF